MRIALCLLLAFMGAAGSARGLDLVAPPDWTADPNDAPVDDVIVYWWVEDAQGGHLLAWPAYYLQPGEVSPVDLSLVPPGTYVCVRGWAFSSEMFRRDAQGWYPPGFYSGFAPVGGVCLEVP
jgi:hypothetical protein